MSARMMPPDDGREAWPVVAALFGCVWWALARYLGWW